MAAALQVALCVEQAFSWIHPSFLRGSARTLRTFTSEGESFSKFFKWCSVSDRERSSLLGKLSLQEV